MLDENGSPKLFTWGSGLECVVSAAGATCETTKWKSGSDLICPQLPKVSPPQVAEGHKHGEPPANWTCAPDLYYEMASGKLRFTCDCGCGIVDPDCGYYLSSCEDQTWNPQYTELRCEGELTDSDQAYCRLESATCNLLPPGLARGKTSDWTCIPDIYNELADPGTSLNDCDCNCGGFDPDCMAYVITRTSCPMLYCFVNVYLS